MQLSLLYSRIDNIQQMITRPVLRLISVRRSPVPKSASYRYSTPRTILPQTSPTTRPFHQSTNTMASSIPLDKIPVISYTDEKSKLTSVAKPLATPSADINAKISTIQTDITKLHVDSIVNAANSSLLGGGGVDGAIHRAAGPKLLDECEELDGCDTGSAKITKGYELPAKHVIHAVGPIYRSGKKEQAAEDLAGCYRTSLQLAADNDCKSIAFAAISTGVYGYPSQDAAMKACETVRHFLENDSKASKIERVIFCNFLDKDVKAYEQAIPTYFPPV